MIPRMTSTIHPLLKGTNYDATCSIASQRLDEQKLESPKTRAVPRKILLSGGCRAFILARRLAISADAGDGTGIVGARASLF